MTLPNCPECKKNDMVECSEDVVFPDAPPMPVNTFVCTNVKEHKIPGTNTFCGCPHCGHNSGGIGIEIKGKYSIHECPKCRKKSAHKMV